MRKLQLLFEKLFEAVEQVLRLTSVCDDSNFCLSTLIPHALRKPQRLNLNRRYLCHTQASWKFVEARTPDCCEDQDSYDLEGKGDLSCTHKRPQLSVFITLLTKPLPDPPGRNDPHKSTVPTSFSI